MTYDVWANTDDFVVFTFENYVGLIYKTKVTEEAIQETYECFLATHEVHGKVFVVVVVPANLEAPDYDTSLAIRAFLGNVGKDVLASVVIHQDIGWRISLVKGITASIKWLAKVPFPHKPFISVGEAAYWLQAHYQVDPVNFKEVVESAITDLQGKPLPKVNAEPEQTIN